MNIGIIGSGEMGTCLALYFVKQGHTVSIANSRGPESLKQVSLDTGAVAVTIEEVTRNKNLIVVSIPEKNIPDIKRFFQHLPEEVVVIDTGNYYPGLRDGIIPSLDQSGIDSLWVQQQLAVPIVKVFNAILATSIHDLRRSKAEKNRIAMAVSGDNKKSKQIVFHLVDELGFDPFDIGDIHQSWKQQPGSTIYCRDINLEELKKRVDIMGYDWANMQDKILAKRMADEALMKADYQAYLKELQH